MSLDEQRKEDIDTTTEGIEISIIWAAAACLVTLTLCVTLIITRLI